MEEFEYTLEKTKRIYFCSGLENKEKGEDDQYIQLCMYV